MDTSNLNLQVVNTGANWQARELESQSGWRIRFSQAHIAEIDAALKHTKQTNPNLDLAQFKLANFPLPNMSDDIRRLQSQLVNCGVQILEGFPIEAYSLAELRAIYWGLANHIGTPVVQSKRGDLLGDVRDIGTGLTGRTGRGYTSNQELNFHCDGADVTGLFFLKTAKSGGVSRIASSVAVHNAIAHRRPDLLDVLYQPLCWSWQGNEQPGQQAYYEMPVFGQTNNKVACAYIRTVILLAEKNAGAPAMSAAQIEAVELVASIAREPNMYVEAMFEPGTMAFMNNHTVFHMRTQFEDWPERSRKRHLLRVWLSPPNNQQLPASFADFFSDLNAGAVRGGFPSNVQTPVFETV